MWKLTDLNEETDGTITLFEQFEHYVREKNLNFIVARGKCVNLGQKDLGQDRVMKYLAEYAACDFSMIALFNGKPKAPFIAANMEFDKGIAMVQYLIDFNEEAAEGKASPFYSKMLGAFATNFFAVHPQIEQLLFPFAIDNIPGSKMGIQSRDLGTAILQ